MLKHRLKRIEDKINKAQGKRQIKLWIIDVSPQNSKKETNAEKKIQDIMSGKVPYGDGSYFSEKEENIFVISAVPRPRSNRQN